MSNVPWRSTQMAPGSREKTAQTRGVANALAAGMKKPGQNHSLSQRLVGAAITFGTCCKIHFLVWSSDAGGMGPVIGSRADARCPPRGRSHCLGDPAILCYKRKGSSSEVVRRV